MFVCLLLREQLRQESKQLKRELKENQRRREEEERQREREEREREGTYVMHTLSLAFDVGTWRCTYMLSS